MDTYVTLLRGINVGGRNLIKMSALEACFEAGGFEDVATYIQSGNVLFRSLARSGTAALARRIEEMLTVTFGYQATVVLRSLRQMRGTVRGAPKGFGEEPDSYRYDVIFLKEPMTASVALKSVPTSPGVDEAQAGKGVVYFSRLTRHASQSRLGAIASLPIYRNLTIRNWNTTTTLLRMMEDRDAG